VNALAFCLSVNGVTRLSILQPLTFRAFERKCRAFPVIDLAGVPFEVPFRKVARQMRFANRIVGAINSALAAQLCTTYRNGDSLG
jgi:hypothetical protein